METFFSIFLFLSLFTLFLKPSFSETIFVDGVAEWKNPTVLIGDTIIFKHKHHSNLYIFHTKRAFELCNFTQAVLLTDPKSNSFTWHPSRPGFFYFLFSSNGSIKACQGGDKLPVKVSLKPSGNAAFSPKLAPQLAPSPTSGGVVSSSPASQWHFLSPTPAVLPGKGGGIPFINSNPAVPLPTEADAASIHPVPISGNVGQMVGLLSFQIPLCLMVWMILFCN